MLNPICIYIYIQVLNINVFIVTLLHFIINSGAVRIEFVAHGEWDVGAYFNAKFEGQLKILFDNILNFGKTKTFFIGPLPVVIRPYIRIYAEFVTLPFQVYAGIR